MWDPAFKNMFNVGVIKALEQYEITILLFP